MGRMFKLGTFRKLTLLHLRMRTRSKQQVKVVSACMHQSCRFKWQPCLFSGALSSQVKEQQSKLCENWFFFEFLAFVCALCWTGSYRTLIGPLIGTLCDSEFDPCCIQ